MATSTAKIYADLKQNLLDKGFLLAPTPVGGSMDKFLLAIAETVYENMVLLEDTAGSPASPAHK